MMDENRSYPAQNTPESATTNALTETTPSEPFACPNCGQMLAPTCKVCVACREPVDFTKVRLTPTTQARPFPGRRPDAQPAAARASRGQFSLTIFIISLAAYFLFISGGEHFFKHSHLKPFWTGLLIDGIISIVFTILIYYDGRTTHRPRPVRWALSSLLISVPAYLLISYFTEIVIKSSSYKPLEAGALIDSAIRVSCAIWIYYDASAKRVPRKLRWSLGSFLIWIIVFPWYLSRRRTPEVPCLVMETQSRTFVWTVVWLFLLYAILAAFLGSMHIVPH